MHIISRRAGEGIVIDGQTTATVIEVHENEVTLEIQGPSGEIEQVTLTLAPAELVPHRERELAAC